ncbi:tRNA uridine(34) 5-carboxymethylaminomethyl modification radical SAM/GNAT enzyme Elp3, partial [Candidatus Gracilibacteria bacterium]
MPLSALVLSLLKEKNLTSESLKDAQRAFAKSRNLSTLPSKSQILQAYFQLLEQGKIEKNADFELLLRKRAIRSLSGIVPIQVLTKPFPCPSRCIFCPNDPEMPKSYIKSEPGAMRAFLNQFDPLKQVYNRLYSLQQTGHKTDKIEMIVLGGTWDFYPRDYKIDFIKQLYDACNTFGALAIKNLTGTANWKYAFEITNQDQIQLSSSLEEAIQINETAQHRIIGLTIETRPEFVTDQNCRDRRAMGVTRIEMGVQSTDDAVLDLNKRGHHLAEVEKALHKLRQYAFKFSIHIMPGLYGSTVEKDIQTFHDVYANPYLKPDEIKFYPTSVIPQTELYELYQQGKYEPITTEEISEIIETTFREIIPPYTRIKRLIRDIPATEISAGSNVTNLSQLMHEKLLKKYQKADADFRSVFYHRLYENLQVFSDEEEFFSVITNGTKGSVAIPKNAPTGLLRSTRKDAQPASFQTYLLGKAPELSSFRHFVSLDTRSREVRNKKEK